MMYDLVIKNGLICDGMGNSIYKANIGIFKSKIHTISKENLEGEHVVDALGRVVSPGFINIHSHSDVALLKDPRMASAIYQGITTEVVGNCGFSPAPLLGDFGREYILDIKREYEINVDWCSVGEYIRKVEDVHPSINVMVLVGHGNIRGGIVGMEDKKASPSDLESMKSVLEKAFLEGAWGFSSGLIYPPGVFSDTQELVELGKMAKQHRRIYTTHIRGEGDSLLDAIDEAIEIGRLSGVPVEVSHLKSAGKNNWGKVKRALEKIRSYREEGGFIQHDQYPYTASSTSLSVMLPSWVFDGGDEAFLSRLRDDVLREKIKEEMKRTAYSNGERIFISSLSLEKNKWMEGMEIHEISKKVGRSVYDFVIDLLIEEKGMVGAIYFSMNEEDVKEVMKDPYTSFGTDAEVRARDGFLHKGVPHPRCYGTFPKVLGYYCRELKLLPLEEAVRKMTSLPANILGLQDRGKIEAGYVADLVVFDPDTIKDTATYEDPHRYPEGIHCVVVNGGVAMQEGKILGFYGEVLKPA